MPVFAVASAEDAVSDELEISCEDDADMCVIEACIGSGCSNFNEFDKKNVLETEVETLPVTQNSRDPDSESSMTDIPEIKSSKKSVELSPLAYLDEAADLMNHPKLSAESYETNQSSLIDLSSPLNFNKFTGDIILP